MRLPGGLVVQNLPGDVDSIPGCEDPLEKEMVTHSSILAWEIPWIEEPSGLQFMGSQRVRHDLVTKQQQHRWKYLLELHISFSYIILTRRMSCMPVATITSVLTIHLLS